jgi:hypothetical protein
LLPLIAFTFCLIKPVLGLLWFLYHRRKDARAASKSAHSGTGGTDSPAEAQSPASTSKPRRQSFVGEILGRSAPEADGCAFPVKRRFALVAAIFALVAAISHLMQRFSHLAPPTRDGPPGASLVHGSSRRLA